MIVKLLTEHHLEFLSFKGGCRRSSESTLVKMSNCWKSLAAAQISWELYCTVMNQLTSSESTWENMASKRQITHYSLEH